MRCSTASSPPFLRRAKADVSTRPSLPLGVPLAHACFAGDCCVDAGAVVGDVLLQFAYALASAVLLCPRPPRVWAVSRGHIAVYFD